MQNRKEYLKHLLHNRNWNQEDRDWLLQYLNENDLTELREIAGDAYSADLFTEEPLLEREVSERLLKSIHDRIAGRRLSVVKTNKWLRPWRAAAAAAVIILAAGIGYISVIKKPVRQLVVVAEKHRKTLKLPDGSLVYLEPGSTLKYSGNYGKQERTVALTGEAFFEVQHNAVYPFIVASSLINTTVLGTSFNMEARGAGEAKVVVLTGMVQVQANDNGNKEGEEVILTANKRVVYNSVTHQLQMSDAPDDAKFYMQKQQGRFVYDGADLLKVVNDLQRYYNINVTVDERLQHCAFYGDVNTMDDLEKALTLIAVSLNAKISKDSSGTGYLISGGNCQ
ncbi:FecR family protein [Chitinophaga sp. CF118]|uniref:FecR family protein n=1 Tax=Chitinophaga sp. CF118 TaxID=1884367 RepID=UPI0008E3B43B|nr:FecR domain-containing protein [Chitinophaga sp. CF118]SFE06573.1 FecR family protein [Chitinophaga sp. CF118]